MYLFCRFSSGKLNLSVVQGEKHRYAASTGSEISLNMSFLFNLDYVKESHLIKCAAIVTKKLLMSKFFFLVMIRNHSPGTWLRSLVACMRTGLCMLVMALLFTLECQVSLSHSWLTLLLHILTLSGRKCNLSDSPYLTCSFQTVASCLVQTS